MIALTLPGHFGGPAYAGCGDATVAELTDQLVSMLRAQGIDRAHVVGNSLGGWLALELARCGFARSVVAFSPAGGWRTDDDYRAVATRFRVFYALVPAILVLARPLARFAWLRKALTRPTLEHGERLSPREFVDALRAMSQTRVLRGLLRTMRRDGPAAPLYSGAVPVTVAWGEHDRAIPYARYGASFRARIAGLDEKVVAGAGHVPMLDNPEQVVAHIVGVTSALDHAANVAPASSEIAA